MTHQTSRQGSTGSGGERRSRSSGLQNGMSQNVGSTERVVSALAGAGLALWGLKRGGLSGMLGLAAGAGLAARGVSGHCPWYASMTENRGGRRQGMRQGQGMGRKSAVTRSITVDRPKDEVYRLWRDFSNLPRFMEHIERIEVMTPERSHWVVKAPAGTRVEWDSIVTEDRPGEVIAWRSVENADVPNTGRVEFHEAGNGQGTVVRAVIAYEPPGGKIGETLAKMLGEEPSIQAEEDLRRFKQMIEKGAPGQVGSQAGGQGQHGQGQHGQSQHGPGHEPTSRTGSGAAMPQPQRP